MRSRWITKQQSSNGRRRQKVAPDWGSGLALQISHYPIHPHRNAWPQLRHDDEALHRCATTDRRRQTAGGTWRRARCPGAVRRREDQHVRLRQRRNHTIFISNVDKALFTFTLKPLVQKSFLLACCFFTGGSQYHGASRKILEGPTRKPPV